MRNEDLGRRREGRPVSFGPWILSPIGDGPEDGGAPVDGAKYTISWAGYEDEADLEEAHSRYTDPGRKPLTTTELRAALDLEEDEDESPFEAAT